MSQPVLRITRTYTTQNGRQGVCYMLRGAKAASFVPSACEDIMGWLLGSLGMGVEMDDAMTQKIDRLEIEVRHSSRKRAWCKEVMGLSVKPGGYERFEEGDYLKPSAYPKGYREYVLDPAHDPAVKGWITSQGEYFVVTEEGIVELDADALEEACKPTSADEVWGDVRAEMQEGYSKRAAAVAERALLFEGGEEIRAQMLEYIHGHQTQGLDLPVLEGSDKQVTWANDIRLEALEWAARTRAEWLEEVEDELTEEEVLVEELALEMCDELDEMLATVTSAKLYIDTREAWHKGWGMDRVATFMALVAGERWRTVSFLREVERRAKARQGKGLK